MELRLHEYQKRCVEYIIEHPAAGLFLDMGLGKTAISLTAVAELIDRCEIAKVLVIAPLRVAEDTWSREASKWDSLKHLRVSKILGSPKQREQALKADADIYVINRENVVWLVEYLDSIPWGWCFDMMIIDELSSFKSNTAKRFKALKKVRPLCERVVGLTGTPAANSLMDLWAEMYLLDRGERLGKSLTKFQHTYFKPAYGQGYVVYKWSILPGADKAITDRLKDITVSMKAEDYLELPELIEQTVSVKLPDKALKAYRKMEQEYIVDFEDAEIEAFDATSVLNKLMQMSNGFAYSAECAVRIHEAKLEALKEIIEFSDTPVLVFYTFRADCNLILEKIPGSKRLKDDADIAAWNEGKIPVLVAHPASCGYGLNLQEGGRVMVWYGLPWSLEQYQQAVARLHRQGQKLPVLNYQILAEGTVDENVAASLEAKDVTQESLLRLLKARR